MKGFGGETQTIVALMPPEAFSPEPTHYTPFELAGIRRLLLLWSSANARSHPAHLTEGTGFMTPFAQGKLAALFFWPRLFNPYPWWMQAERGAWFQGWDAVTSPGPKVGFDRWHGRSREP